ncbi:chemotaxis protein CheW [Thiomonas sp.]|uniref:chemotaxis protein CheW n=1 Tax=Thiomonas sp. TaxID=2047785 RepID=UPI002604AC29|nr:chemotaxis protein CheW [Thiomonas sp.]
MAKSSLIEFQGRLAARLQGAQQTRSESRWLAVVAGSHHLLLPLGQSGEISSWEAPTPLPHAQPWFTGLLNLRGVLCGVVDLAGFLGDADSDALSRAGAHSRLVQFSPRLEINCALLVDQLSGLRMPAQFTQEPGSAPPAPPWLGAQMRDASGQVWRELNLALLAQDRRFLQVA